MKVNSKFVRPSDGEQIRVMAYRIEGVAWAGERKVSTIELRFNSSMPWQPVALDQSPTSMVWVQWSYAWNIPRPGQYLIEVRATDDRGDSQPLVRDPDRKDDYESNTPHRIIVEVRAGSHVGLLAPKRNGHESKSLNDAFKNLDRRGS